MTQITPHNPGVRIERMLRGLLKRITSPATKVAQAATLTKTQRHGGRHMPDGAKPVLDVRGLQTVFRTRGGDVHAVNSVSFHLEPGELLGVVGESGSGKSVTMMSLIGLLPMPPAEVRAGEVLLGDVDILKITPAQLRDVRGRRIGFVFQDPMTSLNPVYNIGNQVMEPLRRHMGMDKAQAYKRALELMELVGIPDPERRLKDYPHQFSGGMRQRVMIAIALACDPEVLIADEPTTALDVTIQAQIIELIKDLRTKLGMAIVWITHDLGVIAGIADRVMVMYAGQVVEQAPVKELFANPQHPYTRALLKTIPSVTGERETRLKVIEGQPPILGAAPTACPFMPRCAHAFDRCGVENPTRRALGAALVGYGHDVACHWDATSGAAHA
jgi:oligopeptide transport system ATP-binding protein